MSNDSPPGSCRINGFRRLKTILRAVGYPKRYGQDPPVVLGCRIQGAARDRPSDKRYVDTWIWLSLQHRLAGASWPWRVKAASAIREPGNPTPALEGSPRA